jgi:stage V sporulation protein AA
MSSILYLKIEQCILVERTKVLIGDFAQMECADKNVVNRLRQEHFMNVHKNSNQRTVVSVLAVIQKIHEIYPKLEVQNIGESDFIIGIKPKEASKIMTMIKVIVICLISFFGSVFAMMTFNEDVSALDSFRKVYTWVMGTAPQGATILELSYSIGTSVGIIVFFNHFGKKRLTEEPSPVEVEMSGYDQQVYQTVIRQSGRKGIEKDVH